MIRREPLRPPSECPARHGKGTDIDTALFTFIADDCGRDAYGQPATKVRGYFKPVGPDRGDEVLQTEVFETPARSPVAQAAHYAARHSAIQAQIAAILRGNVDRCPCSPPVSGDCPALDSGHLLLALCRVTRTHLFPPYSLAFDTLDGHQLTADCPLECLVGLLSGHALNPLRRELPILLQRPATVGDVGYMADRRQLMHIRNLGQRRIGEIELVLIVSGLLTVTGTSTRNA